MIRLTVVLPNRYVKYFLVAIVVLCSVAGMNATEEESVDFPEVLFPSWSPGGDYIAFSYSFEDTCDIWSIRTNGTNLRQITADSFINTEPNWSSDAATLYFLSYKMVKDCCGRRTCRPVLRRKLYLTC